ncbi:hypothetical protein L209DRAFT_71498 [Thermothelomyces heterothallicus CBS 203.75]
MSQVRGKGRAMHATIEPRGNHLGTKKSGGEKKKQNEDSPTPDSRVRQVSRTVGTIRQSYNVVSQASARRGTARHRHIRIPVRHSQQGPRCNHITTREKADLHFRCTKPLDCGATILLCMYIAIRSRSPIYEATCVRFMSSVPLRNRADVNITPGYAAERPNSPFACFTLCLSSYQRLLPDPGMLANGNISTWAKFSSRKTRKKKGGRGICLSNYHRFVTIVARNHQKISLKSNVNIAGTTPTRLSDCSTQCKRLETECTKQ